MQVGEWPVAVVEYAYSMNGEWIKVDNSEFTILGQFDRTAAGGQTEKNIPGYKSMTLSCRMPY